MKRKSIFVEAHYKEILNRINSVSEHSKRQWGVMTAAQMLHHCDKILQVGLGHIILPKLPVPLRAIGMITRIEMKFFNNGIPPNMPTFSEVKVKEPCNLQHCKAALLQTLEEFRNQSQQSNLLSQHALFGKMSHFDWGFLQYKHLNHHLKQFNV